MPNSKFSHSDVAQDQQICRDPYLKLAYFKAYIRFSVIPADGTGIAIERADLVNETNNTCKTDQSKRRRTPYRS